MLVVLSIIPSPPPSRMRNLALTFRNNSLETRWLIEDKKLPGGGGGDFFTFVHFSIVAILPNLCHGAGMFLMCSYREQDTSIV